MGYSYFHTNREDCLVTVGEASIEICEEWNGHTITHLSATCIGRDGLTDALVDLKYFDNTIEAKYGYTDSLGIYYRMQKPIHISYSKYPFEYNADEALSQLASAVMKDTFFDRDAPLRIMMLIGTLASHIAQ